MPTLHCLHCGSQIETEDACSGTRLICPSCKGEFDIPQHSARTTHEEEPIDSTPGDTNVTTKRKGLFGSRPAKFTIVAGLLCFIATITRESTQLEEMGFSDRGITTIIGESIGRLIGIGVLALIAALIISGIMSAFKKRFTTTLSCSYSILVIVLAIMSLCGNFVDIRNINTSLVPSWNSGGSKERHTIYEVDGISLILPSDPSGPYYFDAPEPASQVIKRQVGFQSNGQDFSVTTFHGEQYSQYPVNINLAITGGITNMRSVPGTTEFYSQRVRRFPVAGATSAETVVDLKLNGVPRSVQMMNIAKDNHLYQITIEGDKQKVEEWASIIFPSIRLLP